MQTAGSLGHHVVKSSVEAEVVSIGKVEVVSGQRSVSLELVVRAQTTFGTKARSSGTRGGIASQRKLCRDWVAIEADTKDGEQNGQIVAHAVHVLLGVGELGKCHDTVTAQETVVGGSVLRIYQYRQQELTVYLYYTPDQGMVHECRSGLVPGRRVRCLPIGTPVSFCCNPSSRTHIFIP